MVIQKLWESFGLELIGVESVSGIKDVAILVHAENDFIVFSFVFDDVIVRIWQGYVFMFEVSD